MDVPPSTTPELPQIDQQAPPDTKEEVIAPVVAPEKPKPKVLTVTNPSVDSSEPLKSMVTEYSTYLDYKGLQTEQVSRVLASSSSDSRQSSVTTAAIDALIVREDELITLVDTVLQRIRIHLLPTDQPRQH